MFIFHDITLIFNSAATGNQTLPYTWSNMKESPMYCSALAYGYSTDIE